MIFYCKGWLYQRILILLKRLHIICLQRNSILNWETNCLAFISSNNLLSPTSTSLIKSLSCFTAHSHFPHALSSKTHISLPLYSYPMRILQGRNCLLLPTTYVAPATSFINNLSSQVTFNLPPWQKEAEVDIQTTCLAKLPKLSVLTSVAFDVHHCAVFLSI